MPSSKLDYQCLIDSGMEGSSKSRRESMERSSKSRKESVNLYDRRKTLWIASIKETDQVMKEEEDYEEAIESQKGKLKHRKGLEEDNNAAIAIKAVMKEFDTDTSNPENGIMPDTLYTLLRDLIENIDKETCEEWFTEFDTDKNGVMNVNELANLMLTKLMPFKDDEDDVIDAFKQYDPEDTGFITTVELQRALCYLGDKLSDEEFNIMMKKSDIDGDGFVNYEEFVKLMFSNL